MKTQIEVFCLNRRPNETQSESHSDLEVVASNLKYLQRRKVKRVASS